MDSRRCPIARKISAVQDRRWDGLLGLKFAASKGVLMTSQDTIELIETKIQKLPLVDSEVIEIITLLNNPASNFEQIVQKLSPSLAARFLNIANSAYYGGREVRSINYAVQLLGYGKMKDILITSILMDHFTRRLKDFDFEKFLKQAQLCAALSKVLGEIIAFKQLEDLFTVATLQNIGKLVIAVYFKEAHQQIVALKKAADLPSCEADNLPLYFNTNLINGTPWLNISLQANYLHQCFPCHISNVGSPCISPVRMIKLIHHPAEELIIVRTDLCPQGKTRTKLESINHWAFEISRILNTGRNITDNPHR